MFKGKRKRRRTRRREHKKRRKRIRPSPHGTKWLRQLLAQSWLGNMGRGGGKGDRPLKVLIKKTRGRVASGGLRCQQLCNKSREFRAGSGVGCAALRAHVDRSGKKGNARTNEDAMSNTGKGVDRKKSEEIGDL